jgi:hypothetical protein
MKTNPRGKEQITHLNKVDYEQLKALVVKIQHFKKNASIPTASSCAAIFYSHTLTLFISRALLLSSCCPTFPFCLRVFFLGFPVPLPVIQLSTKITCFKVGAKNLFESSASLGHF